MFYHRLAKELGMTVEYMLNNISSREITNWIAFVKIENEMPEEEAKPSLAAELKSMPWTVNQKSKLEDMVRKKAGLK